MVDSLTAGFLQTSGLVVVVGVVLLLIFSRLRTRSPDIFHHRRLLNTWKDFDDFNGKRVGLTNPYPKDTFFGWIRPLLHTPEEEVVRKIGLDAAVFFRFLRTSLIVTSIISLAAAIVLMPAYATGSNKFEISNNPEETPDPVEGLKLISLANVPDKDGRLWATLVMEFITAIVVMYFFTIDFSRFAEWRRDYRVSETPANYALVVMDIPEESRTVDAIRNRFDAYVPGQVGEVILIRQCSAACKLQGKLDKAVTQREAVEYVKSVKGVDPQTRPGPVGCLMCHKPKVDALEYWTDEQERLQTEIADEGTGAELTSSAIVLFTNKKAASLLAQANIQTDAMSWAVTWAGEPDAMHWPALKIPGTQAEIRALAVRTFIFFFTLFWTIPAAFIASLVSLKGLAENFTFLEPILDWNEAITGPLETLLPAIVMSVLISLIPTFFRMVIKMERNVSLAVVERKTRDYFYIFTIYGNFLVVALGAAFFTDLDAIKEDATKIIDALATKVPGTALVFASFILIQSISLHIQISGIVRILLKWIFLKISKTERQKRKARMNGNLFQYFRYFGQSMMILFLSLMFSSMSPIVTVCGVLFFFFANISFRYQILFMTYCPWQGGGNMFLGSYWGTILGLALHQIITVAIFALKQAIPQAIIALIPFIFTLITAGIIASRFQAISTHGSIEDLVQKSSRLDEIPRNYYDVYEQPAGKKTEYLNLNGLSPADDVYSDVGLDGNDKVDEIQSEHHDEKFGYVPDRAADRSDI